MAQGLFSRKHCVRRRSPLAKFKGVILHSFVLLSPSIRLPERRVRPVSLHAAVAQQIPPRKCLLIRDCIPVTNRRRRAGGGLIQDQEQLPGKPSLRYVSLQQGGELWPGSLFNAHQRGVCWVFFTAQMHDGALVAVSERHVNIIKNLKRNPGDRSSTMRIRCLEDLLH